MRYRVFAASIGFGVKNRTRKPIPVLATEPRSHGEGGEEGWRDRETERQKNKNLFVSLSVSLCLHTSVPLRLRGSVIVPMLYVSQVKPASAATAAGYRPWRGA